MSHPVSILSTRPLEAVLIGQAVEKGITINALPFIVTESVKDEVLSRQVRSLSDLDLTAVFTSVNAVEAVVGMLGTTKAEHWKIFCIGAATRRMAMHHFTPAAVAGTAHSASALADEILHQMPAEVFFFCGDQRRDELPGKLSAAGVRVNEWVVYRTIQTPYRIETSYDGIAFFSPSAVHSFFSVNTLPATTPLFAIGSTTADTIRTYCPNPVVTSPSPEQGAMVQQMIDYFQNNI
jgi:uroporphyrinogen-III synthase